MQGLGRRGNLGLLLLAMSLAWWFAPAMGGWLEPDSAFQWVTLRLAPGEDCATGEPVAVTAATAARTAEVLRRRLESFGVRPCRVRLDGDSEVEVGTPPEVPLAAVLTLATRTGLLEVRERVYDPARGEAGWRPVLCDSMVTGVRVEEGGLPGSATLVLALKHPGLRPAAPGSLGVFFEGVALAGGEMEWDQGEVRVPVALTEELARDLVLVRQAGKMPLAVEL